MLSGVMAELALDAAGMVRVVPCHAWWRDQARRCGCLAEGSMQRCQGMLGTLSVAGHLSLPWCLDENQKPYHYLGAVYVLRGPPSYGVDASRDPAFIAGRKALKLSYQTAPWW